MQTPPSLDPQYQRAIEALLKQDLQATEALKALLLKEREALKQRDQALQSGLIEEKSQHLQTLEANRQKRERLLVGLNMPVTKEAWNTLIDNAANPGLTQLWQTLHTAFEECQQANTVNGKMIGRNRQIFSRLLNIMRGQVASPELYNQNGSRQASTGSHQVIEV